MKISVLMFFLNDHTLLTTVLILDWIKTLLFFLLIWICFNNDQILLMYFFKLTGLRDAFLTQTYVLEIICRFKLGLNDHKNKGSLLAPHQLLAWWQDPSSVWKQKCKYLPVIWRWTSLRPPSKSRGIVFSAAKRDQKISTKSSSSLWRTVRKSDQRSPKTGAQDTTDSP